MASITDFKSALASGVQRQHKWRVLLSFPASVVVANETIREASLLATTTSTPTSQIGVIEVSWGGRIVPIPGDRNFSTEMPITFVSVNDDATYEAFMRWQDAMNSFEGNYGVSDVYADIELQLLDQSDNVTSSFVLRDAFPVTVGEKALDATAMDSYATFDCSIRYTHFDYYKNGQRITS